MWIFCPKNTKISGYNRCFEIGECLHYVTNPPPKKHINLRTINLKKKYTIISGLIFIIWSIHSPRCLFYMIHIESMTRCSCCAVVLGKLVASLGCGGSVDLGKSKWSAANKPRKVKRFVANKCPSSRESLSIRFYVCRHLCQKYIERNVNEEYVAILAGFIQDPCQIKISQMLRSSYQSIIPGSGDYCTFAQMAVATQTVEPHKLINWCLEHVELCPHYIV